MNKPMTLNDLRLMIWQTYKVGQVLNLMIHTEDGSKVKKSIKALIVKFNPYTVICKVNGRLESFTYQDLENFTRV